MKQEPMMLTEQELHKIEMEALRLLKRHNASDVTSALETQLELIAQVRRWRNLTTWRDAGKELPPVGSPVTVVFDKGAARGVAHGSWHPDSGWHVDERGTFCDDVTDWLPIPKLPEER